MDFKQGGRTPEAGLNLGGQLQKVYDLGDTHSRKAFPGRDPGLGETGIVVELLAPALCQQKWMHARFLHLGFLLRRRGEVLKDARWEGERVNDERLLPPSGKGDAKSQTEVPASSDCTHACGANSISETAQIPAAALGQARRGSAL